MQGGKKMQQTQTDQFSDVNLYLEYIRKCYDRISEHEQHTGITRWAILAALAYIAWQAVPLLAKIRDIEASWSHLWIASAYLSTISFFVHFMYQSLAANRQVSRYDYRQINKAGSTSLSLSLSIILVSFTPAIFLSYMAWAAALGLSDLQYRFLSLITWVLSSMALCMIGVLVHHERYVSKHGWMPPYFFAANKHSGFSVIYLLIPLFFCCRQRILLGNRNW
mgnify:CR=1 FL=1